MDVNYRTKLETSQRRTRGHTDKNKSHYLIESSIRHDITHGVSYERGWGCIICTITTGAHETKVEMGVNHGPYNALDEIHTCEIRRHRFKRIKEQTQRDPRYPSNDNNERNDEGRKLLPKEP